MEIIAIELLQLPLTSCCKLHSDRPINLFWPMRLQLTAYSKYGKFFPLFKLPRYSFILSLSLPSKYQKWSMNSWCKDLKSLTCYWFHVFLIHKKVSTYNMTGYETSLSGVFYPWRLVKLGVINHYLNVMLLEREVRIQIGLSSLLVDKRVCLSTTDWTQNYYGTTALPMII